MSNKKINQVIHKRRRKKNTSWAFNTEQQAWLDELKSNLASVDSQGKSFAFVLFGYAVSCLLRDGTKSAEIKSTLNFILRGAQ